MYNNKREYAKKYRAELEELSDYRLISEYNCRVPSALWSANEIAPHWTAGAIKRAITREFYVRFDGDKTWRSGVTKRNVRLTVIAKTVQEDYFTNEHNAN